MVKVWSLSTVRTVRRPEATLDRAGQGQSLNQDARVSTEDAAEGLEAGERPACCTDFMAICVSVWLSDLGKDLGPMALLAKFCYKDQIVNIYSLQAI